MGPEQEEWLKFLRQHEGLLPGVTSAARSLFATLVFGACKLGMADPERSCDFFSSGAAVDPVQYKPNLGEATRGQRSVLGLDVKDFLVFARFLVLRMIHKRQQATGAARGAMHRRQALTIAHKLYDGSMKPRDITRRCHRLSISDCREALDLLKRAGIVGSEADTWTLTSPLSEVEKKLQATLTPVIDV
ncbi:MAG: hypothetical protein EON58_06330 [Alphaproteobacteria bacterium]|nr:MAG: hypothetical protein EON58_06330 [Alphaproteobacteria bacterium]